MPVFQRIGTWCRTRPDSAFVIVLVLLWVVGTGTRGSDRAARPETAMTDGQQVEARGGLVSSPDASLHASVGTPIAPPSSGSPPASPAIAATPPGTPEPTGLLAAAEVENLAPNELGRIPILEYHDFTTDPTQEDQWTRTIDDFRADLQWLYDHNFYIVPLRDIVVDQISAPPGKHPAALTFDDGTVGQFRFLPQPDGSLQVDPNSAVGVLEDMFAAHPDFGRGGHFAVLPFNCFDVPDEPDQEPYCREKLQWFIAHGYEIGNHTDGHTDLLDVDDERFKATIAGAVAWIEEHVPDADWDILTMPFGNYPDPERHPNQWAWLREGFSFNGRQITLVAALKVGAGPAPSPVSATWDPFMVPRIQAFDEWLARWWAELELEAETLYTSDGNPDTITIPENLPPALEGTFDPTKAAGKRVIEY